MTPTPRHGSEVEATSSGKCISPAESTQRAAITSTCPLVELLHPETTACSIRSDLKAELGWRSSCTETSTLLTLFRPTFITFKRKMNYGNKKLLEMNHSDFQEHDGIQKAL